MPRIGRPPTLADEFAKLKQRLSALERPYKDDRGTAVLSGGTATVTHPLVSADSVITVSYTGGLVSPGYISAMPGSGSFVIQSTNGSDSNTVAWYICG